MRYERIFTGPIATALAAGLVAIAGSHLPATAQNASAPVAQGAVQDLMKDDKQWPMAAKNYANTRFSSLDQINAGNVAQLKLAWSFSVGVARGQEAAPL